MEAIKIGIGVAITAFLIWQIALSGGMSGIVEQVETTTEWENAIDSDNSENYSVENDTLFLEDQGDVETISQDIGEDESNVTFTANVSTGDVTVSAFDENDSQIDSEAVSDGGEVEFDIGNDVESYNVQFQNDQSSDSEVDSYETKGDEADSFALFQVMIVALIGVGIVAIFN